MSLATMKQVLSDVDEAIIWVRTLIPDLKPTWRYFHYRNILQDLIDNAIDETYFNAHETKIPQILEAFNAARIIKLIHSRFRNKTDQIFKEKLKEATYGPLYPSQETKDLLNLYWGSHGRNTESELILAALTKNPDSVSFNSADYTVSVPNFKIGVEVKRMHSLTGIVRLYLKAARQIQENPSINYGIVMMRFDRLVYSSKNGTIHLPKPILEKRRWVGARVRDEQKIFDYLKLQVEAFQNNFAHLFLAETKKANYKKVLGYGLYINMPFAIGQPERIKNESVLKLTYWGATEGDTKRVQARQEFVESQDYRKVITIKKPSSIVLL